MLLALLLLELPLVLCLFALHFSEGFLLLPHLALELFVGSTVNSSTDTSWCSWQGPSTSKSLNLFSKFSDEFVLG